MIALLYKDDVRKRRVTLAFRTIDSGQVMVNIAIRAVNGRKSIVTADLLLSSDDVTKIAAVLHDYEIRQMLVAPVSPAPVPEPPAQSGTPATLDCVMTTGHTSGEPR